MTRTWCPRRRDASATSTASVAESTTSANRGTSLPSEQVLLLISSRLFVLPLCTTCEHCFSSLFFQQVILKQSPSFPASTASLSGAIETGSSGEAKQTTSRRNRQQQACVQVQAVAVVQTVNNKSTFPCPFLLPALTLDHLSCIPLSPYVLRSSCYSVYLPLLLLLT